MTEDALFDVASLTKVLATAPSVMILIERGLIELDSPVAAYLPDFAQQGKEAITVRHLMTHTSGLRAGLVGARDLTSYSRAVQLACEEAPQAVPGKAFRYSDINYILLGEIVARVGKQPLNEFAEEKIYRPLRMTNTFFLPLKGRVIPIRRIVPTEVEGGIPVRGVVHDPTSRKMGGVAGHAGLFTTVSDTARFARMMLNEGELEGVRIMKAETVRLMTQVQSPRDVQARRGLGWDIDSDYSRPRGSLFPIGSYGHTGFTGTCLWIDPSSRSFWIFYSNRVHPTRDGSIAALQRRLATLSAEAIPDFDFRKLQESLPANHSTAK